MKKNNIMRIACALLVLTLLSTCVISGTFAKYVTMDDANDSARVAKFGVVVTADGSLFEDTYKDAPTTTEDEMTVVAADATDVVAPGTTNADDAFKFSITGTPEVDVRIDVNVTEADNDVFLKAGDYENLTTGDASDTTTVATDYYPVKYTLTKQGTPVVSDVNLAGLKTALEAITTEKVDANTNLATAFGEYEITWAWAYGTDDGDTNEAADINGNDEADTILGDLAAGSPAAGLDGAALVAGTDYNLTTGLKVTVAVTQID